MKTYVYTAYSKEKIKIYGEIELDDDVSLREALKREKLILINFKIKKEFILFPKKIKKSEIINFSYEMGIMLESGIGILETLKIQKEIITNKKFKEIISEVSKKITQGNGLGDSLKNYQIYFGDLYINIVIVGDISGTLPIVLNALALRLEESEKVKKKIYLMLIYPTLVVILSVLLSLFLIFFILPQFVEIFATTNQKLPFITKLLISTFNLFHKKFFYITVCGISLLIFLIRKKYSLQIKNILNIVLIKTPLIKKIFINYFTITFLRNFYLLIKSGVSILKTLEILIKLEKNLNFKKELEKLKENLKIGVSMSDSLEGSIYFDKISITMFRIGEKSGTLLEMIEKNIEFNEIKFKETTDFFLIILEPLLIIFLGLTVGTIIIGIYLPMFDMINLAG